MMGQRVGRSVPGAVRLTIDSHLGLYSGYLIVKLRLTTGGALSREESLERIRQFSSEFVGAPVPCSWLIYSVSPERLEALEAALSDEERPSCLASPGSTSGNRRCAWRAYLMLCEPRMM